MGDGFTVHRSQFTVRSYCKQGAPYMRTTMSPIRGFAEDALANCELGTVNGEL